MSVTLEPSSQLSFRKPFSSLVRQTLLVNNFGSQPVAFKVKTTAPKLYCVRPNSGKVDPGNTVEVAVLLQPMKEDPPLNVKCKDKFLVQSTVVPPGMDANDVWTLAATDKSMDVHQQKLKVVYLPAEGTLHEEDEPETHQTSVMTDNDSHRYETVRQGLNGSGPEGAAMAIPVFESEPNPVPHRSHTPDHEFTNAHEHHDTAPIPAVTSNHATIASSTVPSRGGAPAGVSPTVDLDSEHARRLAEANAEIDRLKALLARNNETTLKRRTIFSDDGTSIIQDGMTDGVTDIGDDGASVVGGGTMIGTKTEGVPLNVVAALSVLVFVVTYLFF